LIDLPGIGPYTAAAIASFAYNQPVAVVDGNVLRVLSRVFGIKDDIRKSHKNFSSLANQLIPADQPATFNQAIMEFGAMQCSPGLPNCSECPLTEHCYAYQFQQQSELPVKTKLKKIRHRYIQYIVMQRGEELLMRVRQAGDIWQGLYDFPSVESDEFLDEETLLHRIQKKMGNRFVVEESSGIYEHALSHQKIHAKFIKLKLENSSEIPGNVTCANEEKREKLPKPVLISRYLNDHNF
jgi:A/G-specific adenine glycosylase